jgi:hypothetical protein
VIARALAIALALWMQACSSCGSDLPLDEAILGEWEIVCRTDDEATSECIGREQTVFIKLFQPDGTIEASAVGGSSMSGQWSLVGGELEIVFEGGGMRLEELYRARIEDDRLILWDAERGHGSIYVRRGAPVDIADSEETDGDPVSRTVGGIHYTLAVPDEYRLAEDNERRQRWEPISGEGLTFALTVGNRSRELVGEEWVTPPCEPDTRPLSVGSAGRTIDGVDSTTSVGVMLCVGERDISCDAGHTRGYLREEEIAEGTRICRTLTR